MAEKTSWTDLLAYLIRSFILLRDVFGYFLSGAVFLLIGSHSGHLPQLHELCKVCGGDMPKWVVGFLLVMVSYVSGHFVVATVYLVPDAVKLVVKGRGETTPGKEKEEEKAKQNASDLLFYRKEYPDIFIELDRRSIMAFLRVGLAGSVLIGLAVFYWLYQYPRILLWLGGLIMLFSAYTANRHVQDMIKDTLEASKKADEKDASKLKH